MNKQKEFYLNGKPIEINGASYAGAPLSNTVMFVSKKVESLLENIKNVIGCLVFIESDVIIPEDVDKNTNLFVRTDFPQRDYAEYVNQIAKARIERDRDRKYTLTEAGYTIGENVHIGDNALIEPGVIIGHDVVIGKNATLLAGAVIKNAIIGDNFVAGENCTIGTLGFNFAKDEKGNSFRIPSLGKIRIGNGVEISALTNVTCGIAGDTIIRDYAKVDVLTHISHDNDIGTNTEIAAGTILGGFDTVGDNVFIGVNACVKNRLKIANSAFVGMGSAVIRNIGEDAHVFGNPAR